MFAIKRKREVWIFFLYNVAIVVLDKQNKSTFVIQDSDEVCGVIYYDSTLIDFISQAANLFIIYVWNMSVCWFLD